MKRPLLFLLALALSITGLEAQQQPTYDVATTWPEVHLQIFHIERITGNRLVIGVKIYATPQAASGGTFIGVTVPVPQNATRGMIQAGLYLPKPFSLESAAMTDELANQTYSTVKPDSTGPTYVSGTILTTLHPNEGQIMSIQFPIPPPPPANGGSPAQQTVSILLPQAVGPITHITLPPAKGPTPTATQ